MNLTALTAVANSVRSLAIDAVEKAKSGPPRPADGMRGAGGATLRRAAHPLAPGSASGSTGIGLSFPPVTAACSCIRFCTFPATTSPWTTSGASASSAPARRVTPSGA